MQEKTCGRNGTHKVVNTKKLTLRNMFGKNAYSEMLKFTECHFESKVL